MTKLDPTGNLFGGIGTLEQALDYHLDRQVLLNANVANANTPGYRPVDLGFLPAVDPAASGGLALLRTEEGHIDPAQGPAMMLPFEDPAPSPGNDQNAVDMDRELAKVSANALRYETAAELAARRLGLIKYAANDGSGS